MARRKRSGLRLPEVGEAFAFPIGDGRFSVCRVILGLGNERGRELGFAKSVFAAGSAWIGDAIPNVDDPSLRPILALNHHHWIDFWRTRYNAFWIPFTVPRSFIPIGKIIPTIEDERIPCDALSVWETLARQTLYQWRWDNDREAVLAEDAVELKMATEAREREKRNREEYLARVTLGDLRKHKFFTDWTYPSAKARSASQKIVKETVERLLALGANSSEADRLLALQQCMEAFNKLDAQMEFIETEEREDICEEFQAVASACGLGPKARLADKWRKW